jgi:hypothetical protein
VLKVDRDPVSPLCECGERVNDCEDRAVDKRLPSTYSPHSTIDRGRADAEVPIAITSPAYRLRMDHEIHACFWEQEDAEAVAVRLEGEVRRGRFHGEDDDEDHPWVVVLRDVDDAVLDELLGEYDGWLETTADVLSAQPPELPTGPRRFKRT